MQFAKRFSCILAWLICPTISLYSTTITYSFAEDTMAGADQFITPISSGAVGGIVIICEPGIEPVITGNPTPVPPPGGGNPLGIRDSCGGGSLATNFGISDVLAFLPYSFPNNPGILGLYGELASDKDGDTQYADLNGVVYPGTGMFATFVNAPYVAITEAFDSTGTIEYEPGQGEPGFLGDNSPTAIYQIKSDCDPGEGPCPTENIPPQIPPGPRFDPAFGGEWQVRDGADIEFVPEPGSFGLLSAVLALGAALRKRRKL